MSCCIPWYCVCPYGILSNRCIIYIIMCPFLDIIDITSIVRLAMMDWRFWLSQHGQAISHFSPLATSRDMTFSINCCISSSALQQIQACLASLDFPAADTLVQSFMKLNGSLVRSCAKFRRANKTHLVKVQSIIHVPKAAGNGIARAAFCKV